MLGTLFLFINKRYERKLLAFSFGISSSVMFLISILELIPESVLLLYKKVNIGILLLFSLILLYIGYLLVNIIDKKINREDKIYKIGILSAITLLLHNIPEGILCAISSYSDLSLGIKLSFIIMIHNITEGIAICLPIYYASHSKVKAMLFTFVSSFGEVGGALLTMIFLKNYINSMMLFIVLLVTAGIMITLSISKIFKEGFSLKENKYFYIGLLLGFIIVIITL